MLSHSLRLPSSDTALDAAESFFQEAIERLERSVLRTSPEGPNRTANAIVSTVHLMMTGVVNYAADGWAGSPRMLDGFLREALRDALAFMAKNGAARRGCPSIDQAADVILGAASMLSHAMTHFLQKESEPPELLEQLSTTMIFGVLVRAFHKESKMQFSDFEHIVRRYFDDACELYRRELADTRPAGSAVH